MRETVDICLPVASKGGFERVLNLAACYLKEKDYNVRVIQMLWGGRMKRLCITKSFK